MSTDKARRGRPKGSGLDDRLHLDALRGLIAHDPSLKPTTAIKMLGITDPSAIRRLRDKFKSEGQGALAMPQSVLSPRESLDPLTALPKSIVARPEPRDLEGSGTAVLERVRPIRPPEDRAPAVRALKIVATAPSSQPPSERQTADAKVSTPEAAAGTRQTTPDSKVDRTAAPPSSGGARSAHDTSSTSKPQSHGAEVTTQLVRWYALGMTAALSQAEAQVKVMESVLKAPPVQFAVKQQIMFYELAKMFFAGAGSLPKRR